MPASSLSDTEGSSLDASASNSMSKKNREPTPSSLSSHRVPPMASIRRLEMLRPSPVPPWSRAVVAVAWENGSRILPWCSFGIPIPVSYTSKSSLSPLGPTRSPTSPSLVNFSAFPMRFTRICRSLIPSTRMLRGTPAPTSESSSTPCLEATPRKPARVSSVSLWKSVGSGASSILPASIRE